MMNTTDDKFKRFVAMTDHPERFSDEELMELVRDPEMAAWYQTLADVEEAAKSKAQMTRVRGSRYHTLIISLLATAAILTIAFILWPRKNILISQPLSGERSAHLGERAEAMTQQPALEATVAQPQPTISSKALAERKRKKAIPKPIPEPLQEEVPDESQTNEETAHPIDLYEASYRPQIDEIMTVEELRARGNRLTENIRQQLQAINVTY